MIRTKTVKSMGNHNFAAAMRIAPARADPDLPVFDDGACQETGDGLCFCVACRDVEASAGIREIRTMD
jgi:hypothetical protein